MKVRVYMTVKKHTRLDYEDFLNGLFPTDYILKKFRYMIKTNADLGLASEGKFGTLLKKHDLEFFIQGYKHWAIQAEYQDYKARISNMDKHVMDAVRIPFRGKMHIDLLE